MELTGKRILLREFAESDVGALLAVHSDPRVLRYYPPEVGTPEHARMLVEMFIRWANESPRQNFQLAIVDLETNALLGSCGIRRKGCPPDQAEFGIGIGADWWGRGIAQEDKVTCSATSGRRSSWHGSAEGNRPSTATRFIRFFVALESAAAAAAIGAS